MFIDPPQPILTRLGMRRFLAIGRRTNLDLDEELDFSTNDWKPALRRRVAASGVLSGPTAVDYFFMPRREMPVDMPPFAVGRPAWDGWMCARAWDRHIPLVDLTRCLPAVHQRHDYEHVKLRTGKRWRGPEGDENRRLAADLPLDLGPGHSTYRADERGRLSPDHRNLARMYWRMDIQGARSTWGRSFRAMPRVLYHALRSGELAARIRRLR